MARKLSAAAMAAPQPPPTDDGPDAFEPAIEYLVITDLVRHPRNARTIQPTSEHTAALLASVRSVGVLMPVMVAPMDDGRLGVLAGWQRVSAAQAAGRIRVPALRVASADAGQRQLSLVENTLRVAMHPVDAWRSTDTLMQGGASLDVAAATLGLSPREANRMRLLSQMHPDMLDAMATSEVPDDYILRDIVRVPHDRQAEVLNAARVTNDKNQRVVWNTVAAACRVTRISRDLAVFAHAKSNVVFDRDWFSEPGSSQEWSTTDVIGFLAAQKETLANLVNGNDRAGVWEWQTKSYGPDVPSDWRLIQWMQKLPKTLPDMDANHRFAVTVSPSGEVLARIYRVPADTPDPALVAGSPPDVAARAATRLITDAGLQMAADMKAQALSDALEEFRDNYVADQPAILLRALLECLAAQNVTPGAAQKHEALEAIAEATLGGGEPSPSTLVRIATNAIASMLVFPAPKVLGSGPVADEVAASLNAERYLPRCDTPAFLAQCSGAMLREAAQTVERQPGQKIPSGVAVLREFLAGKLPDWRPVTFFAAKEPANAEAS